MRKRDIKMGMEVQHALSGKYLGAVERIGAATVSTRMLDGRRNLASFTELAPAEGYPSVTDEEET